MSAGRHAPGPWHIGMRYGATKTEITDSLGNALATVWTHHAPKIGEPVKESLRGIANARLIAQAPAYAAATQPVVDNLVGQDDTPDDDFIPVRAGDLRALNEAHLKAIGQ